MSACYSHLIGPTEETQPCEWSAKNGTQRKL